MSDKKQKEIVSPDLNKMIRVVINPRTTIYVEKGQDPEEARQRYLDRVNNK